MSEDEKREAFRSAKDDQEGLGRGRKGEAGQGRRPGARAVPPGKGGDAAKGKTKGKGGRGGNPIFQKMAPEDRAEVLAAASREEKTAILKKAGLTDAEIEQMHRADEELRRRRWRRSAVAVAAAAAVGAVPAAGLREAATSESTTELGHVGQQADRQAGRRGQDVRDGPQHGRRRVTPPPFPGRDHRDRPRPPRASRSTSTRANTSPSWAPRARARAPCSTCWDASTAPPAASISWAAATSPSSTTTSCPRSAAATSASSSSRTT